MAGMRPAAIVLGKLLASLTHVAALIVASLPIVMLCLPLGGVSLYEVLAAYLGLAVSVITFGMISVTCSSYFPRTAASLVVSYLIILPPALGGALIAILLETLRLATRGRFPLSAVGIGLGAVLVLVSGALGLLERMPGVDPSPHDDRCGVVDNTGDEIFADKVGVMLARDMSTLHPGSTFVVDVKSTGLYVTDPVLQKNGVKADYWKTGHSYMKRRTHEVGALAGFEKSGHYFFNKPFGRGYDDGLVSALAVCDMMDRNPGKSMAELKDALPKTWGSPTMAPHCDDEKKYGIVEKVVKHFEAMKAKNETLLGQPIRDLVTVNGVRVTVQDGTWGLVRASSNKPELVVVVESPVSDARMREMFKAVDGVLRTHPEVGAYNQTI